MENKIEKNPLLKLQDVSVLFKVRGSYFKALQNISFDVNKGDFFGIIGESGSGKSTTGKAIIKLYPINGGSIIFEDNLVSKKKMSRDTKKWFRKNVQMIFQDPMSSMNPIKSVMNIISEPLIINRIIQHEALSYIKKVNKVKNFFHYRFNEKNFKLLNDFLHDYYSIEKKELELSLSKIKSINLEFVANLDNYISLVFDIFDNLIAQLKNNLQKSYNLIVDQSKIISETIEKYNNHDLEDVDLWLDEVNEKIRIKKNEFKFSNKYFELHNKIHELKKTISSTKKEFYLTYLEKNLANRDGFLSSVHSSYKVAIQNYHASHDKINALLNYVIKQQAFEKYKLASKLFKQIKYLSLEEWDKLIDEINKHIDEKYAPIIEFVTQTKNNFKISTVEGKAEIINEIKTIKLEVDQMLNQDKMEKEILFVSFLETSNQIWNAHLKCLEDMKQEIEFLKKETKMEKSNYAQVIDKSKLEEEFKNLKKDKEEILEKRQSEIDSFIKYLESVKPEREQLINHNKALVKDCKKLWFDFKKEIFTGFKKLFFKSKQKDKKVKEFFSNVSTNLSLVFSSLNKLKAYDAINFENKNSLKQIKKNKSLYNAPNLFSYFYYFTVKHFLTKEKVFKALSNVGLKYEHAYRYPHEFSGGQRQRIVIARALITQPKLIIADEPISALDVSIQSQVINIMKKLAVEEGVTFLFIAHDLSMVNYACNKMIIMHKGRIVEKGDVNQIFKNPIHPYTQSLMKAIPELSRIHVDLSSFDENLDYDKNVNWSKDASFHNVGNENHEVFATKEQFLSWAKLKAN